MDAMLSAACEFTGLPHRCETVVTHSGVTWINDSKATNVGATVAAIDGLAGDTADIVLVAGGQGKGQDFSELASAAKGRVKLAIVMGEDASLVADKLSQACEVVFATSMEAAVCAAADVASPGDKVLLSPACASFDMFKGFEDRGNRFSAAARGLV